MMSKALRALPPANYSEAAVSQLAIYADEYRRGSFAVNAPTNDVRRVGGRVPERFDSIVRRAVAERPGLRTTPLGRVTALTNFLKILLTPALDLTKVQSDRDYVRITHPKFSQNSADWVTTHKPQQIAQDPVSAA